MFIVRIVLLLLLVLNHMSPLCIYINQYVCYSNITLTGQKLSAVRIGYLFSVMKIECAFIFTDIFVLNPLGYREL